MVSSTALAANSGCSAQERPLVGVITEHLHRGGELVSSGVRAGNEQTHDQHAQLVGVEVIAIVFGADQLGDQVVGQRVTAVSDHIVDVVVDGLPCRQDGVRLGGNVPAEGLEDVVGPFRRTASSPRLVRRAARR